MRTMILLINFFSTFIRRVSASTVRLYAHSDTNVKMREWWLDITSPFRSYFEWIFKHYFIWKSADDEIWCYFVEWLTLGRSVDRAVGHSTIRPINNSYYLFAGSFFFSFLFWWMSVTRVDSFVFVHCCAHILFSAEFPNFRFHLGPCSMRATRRNITCPLQAANQWTIMRWSIQLCDCSAFN